MSSTPSNTATNANGKAKQDTTNVPGSSVQKKQVKTPKPNTNGEPSTKSTTAATPKSKQVSKPNSTSESKSTSGSKAKPPTSTKPKSNSDPKAKGKAITKSTANPTSNPQAKAPQSSQTNASEPNSTYSTKSKSKSKSKAKSKSKSSSNPPAPVPASVLAPAPAPTPQPVSYSMFPDLHPYVSSLLAPHDLNFAFHNEDTDANCIDSYTTNIMGRFRCPNPACRAVWTSRIIATTIRRYPGNRYNARVYHQRCNRCSRRNSAQPILDDSYAERIAYRIKKWCGAWVETPPFSGQSKQPHKSDLCEGCKAGVCPWGRLERYGEQEGDRNTGMTGHGLLGWVE